MDKNTPLVQHIQLAERVKKRKNNDDNKLYLYSKVLHKTIKILALVLVSGNICCFRVNQVSFLDTSFIHEIQFTSLVFVWQQKFQRQFHVIRVISEPWHIKLKLSARLNTTGSGKSEKICFFVACGLNSSSQLNLRIQICDFIFITWLFNLEVVLLLF